MPSQGGKRGYHLAFSCRTSCQPRRLRATAGGRLAVERDSEALTAALDGYAPKTSPQISVADGASVTGVNFTLQKYATVRGTVTNSSASGIGNVVIKLYDATTASANASYQFITTGSGTFEITHVVPGSYKVMYDASGASYMTRWYNLASTVTWRPC